MERKRGVLLVCLLMILLLATQNSFAARLPVIGGDNDTWGTILNEYLNQSLGENATALNLSTIYLDGILGRAGIGVSNPSQTLNVLGTLNITNGSDLGLYQDSSGQVGIGTSNLSNPFTVSYLGTNRFWVDTSGHSNIYTGRRLYFVENQADIYGVSDGLGFHTGGNTERVRIDSTGNVGIGTLSPTTKLEVNGTINITGIGAVLTFPDGTSQTTAFSGFSSNAAGWANDSTQTYTALNVNTSGKLILSQQNNASNPTIQFGDGDTGIYEATDDNLRISVGGSTRYQFLSTELSGIDTNRFNILYEAPNATNPIYSFQGDEDTGIGRANTDALSFVSGGVHGMTLNETGGVVRVGIGTTTPNAQLHLSSQTPEIYLTDSNNNDEWRLSGANTGSARFRIIDEDNFVSLTIEQGGHNNPLYLSSTGLGINTTNPANTLNVVGDLNVTGTSYLADLTIDADNITVNNINSRDGNITLNNNSGSETVRIVDSGRVGIGTSNPTRKLHVEGGSIQINGTNEGIYFYKDNDITGSIMGLGNQLRVQAETGSALNLAANNSDNHLHINGIGNVGIGTNTPEYALHAVTETTNWPNDVAQAGTTVTRLELKDTDNVQDNSVLDLKWHVGTHWNNLGNTSKGPALTFSFENDNVSATPITEKTVGRIAADISASRATTFDLTFAADNTTEQMRLTHEGRLGINTTNPTQTLTVVGDLNVTGTSYLADLTIDADNITVNNINSKSGNISLRDDSGTEIIKIDGVTDQVGIGTTNPEAPLHIQKTDSGTHANALLLRNSAAAENSSTSIRFDLGTNEVSRIETRSPVTGAAGELLFYTKRSGFSLTEQMRINQNGSVGIGTSSPDTFLHIRDPAGNAILRFELDDTDITEGELFGAIEFEGQDASGSNAGVRAALRVEEDDGSGGASRFEFHTNTNGGTLTERMRLTNEGALGLSHDLSQINVSSASLLHLHAPASASHVENDMTVDGENMIILENQRNGGDASIQFETTQNRYAIGVDTSISGHPFAFYHDNTNIYTITDQGLIGINTTTPSHALNVIGDANITGTIYGDGSGLTNVPSGPVDTDNITVNTIISKDGNITFTDENNTERVRFTSQGRVGIGTATPDANAFLHVRESEASGASAATTHDVIVSERAGVNKLNFITDTSGHTGIVSSDDNRGAGRLEYWHSGDYWTLAANEEITLQTNEDGLLLEGNLTAGTYKNISHRLTVVGGTNITNNLTVGENLFVNESRVSIGASNGTHQLTVSGGHIMMTDYQASLFGRNFLGTGDVNLISSIGNPTRIEINQNPEAGVNVYFENGHTFTLQNDASGDTLDIWEQSNNVWRFRGTTDNEFAFSPNGTETVRFTDGGRVGIGTTTPTHTLNVVGDLNVTGTSYLADLTIDADNITVNNILSKDGNVTFRNSSGAEVGRFTDTGRLGIGITNPTEELDVSGDVQISSALIFTSGDRDKILLNGDTIGPRIAHASDWTVDYIAGRNADTGDHRFYTHDGSAAEVQRLHIDRGGNIGINTSSPAQTLNVVGDLNVTGTSYLADLTIDADNITVNNILSKDGNVTFWNSSGSEIARMTAEGHVGIGVTNPDELLHVEGNTATLLKLERTGQSAWSFQNTPTSGGGAGTLILRPNTVTADFAVTDINGEAQLFINTTSGNVGIGNTTPADFLTIQGDSGGISVYDGTNRLSAKLETEASEDGRLILYERGSAKTILTADTGGNSYINNEGNFGINTSAPGNTLTVVGTLNVTNGSDLGLYQNVNGSVGIGTASPRTDLEVTGNVRISNQIQVDIVKDETSGDFLLHYSGSDLQIGSSSSGFGPVTDILITPSNNVGIGTESPTTKLDVNGSINITGTGAALIFPDGTSQTTAATGGGTIAGTNGYIARFNDTNSINDSALYQNGSNIGIGTTAPTDELNVVGSVNITENVTVGSGTSSLSVPGLGTDSEQFGENANASGTGSVAVGNNATAAAGSSTVLGTNAFSGSAGGIAIGTDATTGSSNYATAIGSSSTANLHAVAIGRQATASQNGAIAIGKDSTAANLRAIAIGEEATTTASNQLVIGGGSTSSYHIEDAYIGSGVTDTTPVNTTIHATGGSGTDIKGGYLSIAGGQSTGSATGGEIRFETSSAGTSGTTLRTLSERMRITGEGNVGIGTPTPTVKLDVNGSINITGSGAALIFPDGTNMTTANGGYSSSAAGWTNDSTQTRTSLDVNITGKLLIHNESTDGKVLDIVNSSGDSLTYFDLEGGINFGAVVSNSIVDIDATAAAYGGGYYPLAMKSDGAFVDFIDSTGATLNRISKNGYGIITSGPSVTIAGSNTTHVPLTIRAETGQTTDILRVVNDSSYSYFEVSATGNVGINTATPANTLNVVGDLNVTGTSYLADLTIDADNITVNGINSRDGNITFSNSSGAEIIRMTERGRLGIGTGNPTHFLDIEGPDHTSLRIDTENVAGRNSYIELEQSTDSRSWQIGHYYSSNRFTIQRGDNANLGQNQFDPDFTIDQEGRVGINTSSTEFSFEVGGMSLLNGSIYVKPSIAIFSGDNSGTSTLVFRHKFPGGTNEPPADQDKAAIISEAQGQWGRSTGLHFAINDDGNGTAVSTNDTHLFIGPTGNIGINTTNPANTLNIVGDLNVTGTSYLGDVELTSDNITANRIISKDGNISLHNTTGSEVMRISETGEVGIGTNNPVAGRPLHLATDGATFMRLEANSNSAAIELDTAGYYQQALILDTGQGLAIRNTAGVHSGDIVFDSEDDWFFRANGTDTVLALLDDGRIGVNTTSPANTFNIVGDLNVTGTSYLADLTIDADNITVNNINSKDGNITLNNNSGAEIVRVTDAGRFGVGTNNPTHTLNVVGDANITSTIRASNFKTDTTNTSVTVGENSGPLNQYNVLVGHQAGTSATQNALTALGYQAGYENNGSQTTTTGYQAGYENNQSFLTATGSRAGYQNTGYSATAMGYQAGYQNTGDYLAALGTLAGYQNIGDTVIAIGNQAGYQNNGTAAISIGYQAGYQNVGGTFTAVGYQAGYENNGSTVTVSGYRAGYQNNGSQVIAIGYRTGESNTGAQLVAIGDNAALTNTGGSLTAVGFTAGQNNSGSSVTAVGRGAGYNNEGAFLTTTGFESGYQNTGSTLTVAGYRAGYQNTGANSAGYGYSALRNNTGENVVAIGFGAGQDNTADSKLIIQQTNLNTNPLIYGDFSTGAVGINTTATTHALTVAGDLNVTGTSYLADLTIDADNITVNNVISKDGNITFSNNSGNEVVRITSNGSVGIGTTNPLTELQIDGGAPAITFNSTLPNVASARLEYEYVSGGHKNSFSFTKSSGVKVFSVDTDNQRVAVGTNTPTRMFELYGSSPVIYLNKSNSVPTIGFITESGNPPVPSAGQGSFGLDRERFSGSESAFTTLADSHVLQRRDGTDLFVVRNTGFVGIGINMTDPTHELTVDGDLNVTGTAYLSDLTINADNITVNHINSKDGNISFHDTNGSEIARFTSSGRFGVGVSNPAYGFEVDYTTQYPARIAGASGMTESERRVNLLVGTGQAKGAGVVYHGPSSQYWKAGVANDSNFHIRTGNDIGDAISDYGFVIDTNLQAGIGVEDPAAALEVNAPTASETGMILQTTDDNTTNNILEIQDSSGTLLANVSAGGAATFKDSINLRQTAGQPRIAYISKQGSHFAVPSFNAQTTVTIDAGGTDGSNKGLIIRGGANQTANLLEWQNDSEDIQGVLNANGSLGLGTAAPTTNLHVVGTTDSSIRIESADGSSSVLEFFEGNSQRWDIRNQGNNADRLTIINQSGDTTFIMEQSGNVGIGTTDPANTLNVVGDLNVTGTSYLANLDINADNITVNNINSKDGNLSFRNSSGNEVVRMTDTGRIGIGTSSPTRELDVRGKALIQPTNLSHGDNVLAISVGTYTGGSTDIDGIVISGDVSGDLDSVVQQNGNGTSRITARVLGTGNAAATYNINGGQGWTVGLDNSDGDKFKISENQDFLSDTHFAIDATGNVGINTTNPTHALNVVGDLNVTGTSYLSDVTINSDNITVNNIYSKDGNVTFRNSSGDGQVHITDNGTVGIGTVNPLADLHIRGDWAASIKMTTPAGGSTWTQFLETDNRLYFRDTNNDSRLILEGGTGIGVNEQDPASALAVLGGVAIGSTTAWSRATAPNGGMTIENNVGIGTDAPEQKLHLNGSGGGDTAVLKIEQGTAGQQSVIELDTPNQVWRLLANDGGTNDPFVISDETNSATRFAVLNNGRVGINDSTPDGTLNVDSVTAGVPVFVVEGHPLQTADLVQISNSQSQQLFVIDSSGNTGIGTANATTKLDVNGTINITGTGAALIFPDGTSQTTAASGSGGIEGVGIEGYLARWNGTASINDSLIYQNGSNIGFGTTAPNRKVEIEGTDAAIYIDSSTDAYLTIDKAATNRRGSIAFFIDENAEWYAGTPDSDVAGAGNEFFIGTESGGTETFWIEQNGNVGIGTSEPETELHIKDATDEAVLRLERNHTAFSTGIDIGVIEFEHNDSDDPGVGVKIIAEALGTAGNTRLAFHAGTPTSIAERMAISGSGEVGIGTGTAQATFEVNGTATIGNGSNTETIDNSGFDHGTGDLYIADELGAEGTIYSDGGYVVGGNTIIDSSARLLNLEGAVRSGAGNSLSLQTNASNAERLVITTAGNVGIGTAAPSELLHINGGEILINGTNVGIIFHRDDGLSGSIMGLSNQLRVQAETGSTLNLAANNSDNHIHISGIGNVGIGTTSPAQLLHVNDSGEGSAVRFEDNDGACDADPDVGGLTWACSSDASLKENIADSGSALDGLLKLRIRDYDVKVSGERKIGVIAQEVQAVRPDLIREREDGILMVSEVSQWEIIRAIQELAGTVNGRTNILAGSEGSVAGIEAEEEPLGTQEEPSATPPTPETETTDTNIGAEEKLALEKEIATLKETIAEAKKIKEEPSEFEQSLAKMLDKTRTENEMLKEELCAKDASYSWCT